jgi:nijmegen breakage syndrome protein 1
VVISSSCSTDETIVADSDTEVETATSPYANEALCDGNNVKHVQTEELDDDSDTSEKRKNERMEAPLDDVSTSVHKRKNDRMEASLDDVSTSLYETKRAKPEMSLDASVRSDTHATSFKDEAASVKVRKDKVDNYASGNSDIVYSQNLIVRDTNILTNRSSALNSSVPNFKRFRKVRFWYYVL